MGITKHEAPPVVQTLDPSSAMSSSKFAADCLQAHNDKRKKHGVSKLKLNSELCVLAQNYAQQLLRSGELKHSKHEYNGSPLGENIAGKTSTGMAAEYTGSEVVEQWYSEIKDYDFKSHNTGTKTGHFSQVVWKDSKELGVGMACKDGKAIVVANYAPAGNYVGMYKDNVFPADGKGAGSKVKSLFGGLSKKADDSSDEEKGGARSGPKTTTTTTGKTKVTITRTITKPDGSVETITEERVEDNPSPHFSSDKLKQTTGKAVSSKPKQSTSDFRKDALETHNKLRSKHKAPKMKMNTDLCNTAQKWAEHLATISSLTHSSSTHKGEPLGENIASKWGSNGADYTGEEVVKQWYSEESAFDYSGKSNAGKSGHFTQVVWKGSEELGIGKATDSKGRVYVVANYRPAGNYIGNFATNVSKP